MKPPPGSRPDSIVIKYIYEKEGKRFEWAADELPADFNTYKYIDRIDKVVRKGNADPAIKGFSLIGISGEDSTQVVLNQKQAILVFAMDFNDTYWIEEMKALADAAKKANVPFYVVSPNLQEGARAFAALGINSIQFFNTDFTIARTVARTTPTVLFLRNGVIQQKFSRSNFEEAHEVLVSPS